MIARPLAVHSPRAVREVLLRYGWESHQADSAATSVEPVAILVEDAGEATIEALVRFNQKLGIDLLTGEGWVLLAGSRSRFAAFARPWSMPVELAELAVSLGRAIPGETIEIWSTRLGTMSLDRPRVGGILNVTPDSFSDGGKFAVLDQALAQADHLLESGADFIDVGGESTRPGATPVSEDQEIARVIPVIRELAKAHPSLVISIDTVKSGVARAALDAGASVVNDVSGLRLDDQMGRTVADAGAGVVLMHSRGSISDMASYHHAEYAGGVVGTVIDELAQGYERALSAGVSNQSIVLDPGLGFSKTPDQSRLLLDQLRAFTTLNRPIFVGPSRKRFLGPDLPPEARDQATAVACVLASERGAQLFRVHNVRLVVDALRVAALVRGTALNTS
ncbi:MAG: dihydropteroate synthase [Gemmatimonadota bacterium]